MTERDYAVDMRAVLDAATDGAQSYIPARVATEVVEKLRVNDPSLLAGWLDEQAQRFVWRAINERDQSRRAMTNRRAAGSVFASATDAAAAGDAEPLHRFLDAPYTVEGGSHKPLADLTRDDLLFVSAVYRQRADDNAMRAAFLAALAKKVRKGTVADYFTEREVAAMFESIHSR